MWTPKAMPSPSAKAWKRSRREAADYFPLFHEMPDGALTSGPDDAAKVSPRGRALALRIGTFCFRWRSYLPLALLPLVAVAIARSQHQFGTRRADLAWEFGCVFVALGGLAIRVWTVGVAAPGTSGRNTRAQKAARLNTTGPYSVVRHPLYLANGVIALGLALFPHAWIAPAIVAPLTLGYYALIVRHEEDYLRQRFGREFEAWAATVPAVVPAPGGYLPADRPFNWRVALRREFYALTIILVAPFLLDLAENLNETGRLSIDPVWTVTAALGGALFLILRFLKKRTSFLDPRHQGPATREPRNAGRNRPPSSGHLNE